MMRPRLRATAIPTLLLLATACEPPRVQHVEWGEAKSVEAARRPTSWDSPMRDRLGVAPMAPATAGGGGPLRFVGDAPAGWEELPPQPSRFRDRLWRIAGETGAECYLTATPTGGVDRNLARWHDQFGIADVAALEALPVVEFAGRPGRLLELRGTFAGKADQAMLLAFQVQSGTVTTTLKFTGPEPFVVAHRDEFLELAGTLRAASASPMPEAPPIERGQQLPDGHPPLPADAPHGAAGAPAASGPFAAEVPEGWTPVAGSPRLLHHGFGDGGEVYVSQLGGSMRQMLDIWRGEIAGAGQLTDDEFAAVPKVPMLGGEAHLLDLGGDYRSMGGKQIPGGRLLVAAIASDGGIVFAKLFGKAADVEAQRAAFLRFCASLRRNP